MQAIPGSLRDCKYQVLLAAQSHLLRSARTRLIGSGLAARRLECTSDGTDALRLLDTAEIVIADCELAGHNGFELAEEIHSAGRRIPVILLSEKDDIEFRVRAAELASAGFITADRIDALLPAMIRGAISSLDMGLYGD